MPSPFRPSWLGRLLKFQSNAYRTIQASGVPASLCLSAGQPVCTGGVYVWRHACLCNPQDHFWHHYLHRIPCHRSAKHVPSIQRNHEKRSLEESDTSPMRCSGNPRTVLPVTVLELQVTDWTHSSWFALSRSTTQLLGLIHWTLDPCSALKCITGDVSPGQGVISSWGIQRNEEMFPDWNWGRMAV